MDAFQSYDNLAGVFVANEAMTMRQKISVLRWSTSTDSSVVNGSDTAPFVKSAIRDVKAYRDSKKYREIPVGYSAGELITSYIPCIIYFQCGIPTNAYL